MNSETFSHDYRIVNVTSGVTAKLLDTLIKTALASKTGAAAILPEGSVIKVRLTSSAALLVSDDQTGDDMKQQADEHVEFAILNAPLKLSLKNAATVSVELFFGR